jgi:hypothetical protein
MNKNLLIAFLLGVVTMQAVHAFDNEKSILSVDVYSAKKLIDLFVTCQQDVVRLNERVDKLEARAGI